MARIWATYDWIERVLALVTLSAMVLTVLVAATGRSMGTPVTWALQFSQLFLIWSCMFGADLAMKRGEHIRVSALPDAVPVAWRRVIAALNVVLILPFLGFLAWLGFELAASNWERELGASGLSYGLVTLALPVGAVLLAISLIRRLFGEGLLGALEPGADGTEYPL